MKIILVLLLYALPFTLYPSPVHAACIEKEKPVNIGECFAFGNFTSLGDVASKLVPAAFSLAAVIVVIYFLLGAFKYLKSAGNKEETHGARQMITHAIVGFIILMFAFLILQFLLSSLFGITSFQLFQS